MTEEGPCHQVHRRPCVLHDQLRDRDVQHALDDQPNRSGRHRGRGMTVAVVDGPRQAEEQAPGRYPAGVEGEVRHLGGILARLQTPHLQGAEQGGDLGEPHAGPSIAHARAQALTLRRPGPPERLGNEPGRGGVFLPGEE